MLTILVGPHKERIQTADGMSMTVIEARVGVGDTLIRLNDVPAFADIEDVSIHLHSNKESVPIVLTPDTREGIVAFLTQHHAHQDMQFDCYAFANLVHGLPVHRCGQLLEYWDIESGGEVSTGDTVFLLDPEQGRFHHAAIYLGKGLFISVYGAGGVLEFSTLDDMQKEMGGTIVAAALPRKGSL